MAFSLDPTVCFKLQQLTNKYDEETLDKICLVSFDCLKSDSSLDSLQDEDTKTLVKHCMTIIVQSIKFGLSEGELNDLLTSIECNAHYIEKFVQLYKRLKPDLCKILVTYDVACGASKRFVQLHWKFELKIASKFAREQLVPIIVLRIHTVDSRSGEPTYIDMQCSPADIFRIIEKVGDALRKSNSQHCIKLMRHIK